MPNIKTGPLEERDNLKPTIFQAEKNANKVVREIGREPANIYIISTPAKIPMAIDHEQPSEQTHQRQQEENKGIK